MKKIEKIIKDIESLEEYSTSTNLQNAIKNLRNELKTNNRSKRSMEIRTTLTPRNVNVLNVMKKGYTYKEAATELGLSLSQVSESVKVLHDQGLLPYKHKVKALMIDECIDDVQRLMKTCSNKQEIAKELGISEQTVVRCIQRISSRTK